MYDIMVINNGSGTTNSPSLQRDHLSCCKPPTHRASDSVMAELGGGVVGVQSFPRLQGRGVGKMGGQPSETDEAAPHPKAQGVPSLAFVIDHQDNLTPALDHSK